jgi:hypothetical protein
MQGKATCGDVTRRKWMQVKKDSKRNNWAAESKEILSISEKVVGIPPL